MDLYCSQRMLRNKQTANCSPDKSTHQDHMSNQVSPQGSKGVVNQRLMNREQRCEQLLEKVMRQAITLMYLVIQDIKTYLSLT